MSRTSRRVDRLPECGEQQALRGEQGEGAIRIRRERCSHEWRRDRDVCPQCGRRSMLTARAPIEKARGTQQSVIGYWMVPECYACGYRLT
jgi:hypothetical protein